MGSISNSLSSVTAPVTVAGSTGSTFMGASSYSTDLQSVITRAVSIANLPIQQLTNQQTALGDQSKELSTLDGLVAQLQTAVQDIDQAMRGSSFTATVSNSSLLSASVSDGAMEGNYSVEVKDIGSYATSMSAAKWGGISGPYTLWINGQSHNIATSDTSANGVAAAINSQYGGQVRATVVNVGGSTPDYRIALQATTLGKTILDIQDKNGASLQTAQTADTWGSQASYSVNGAAPVASNSRSVSISNGLTVTLLEASVGHPVNITVTRSTSALGNALGSFADAYNSVVNELSTQHGQSAGPLQGNPILSAIQSTLSQLGTYSNSTGAVNNLSSLGLELQMNGQITYNQFNLVAADIGNSSGVTSFLGSATGGGFLKSATDALNNLEQTGTGTLKNAEKDLQTQITNLGNTISTKQNQVANLQANLQQQMAAMDALIASMQQQSSYLTNMFQAQLAQSYAMAGR